MAQKKMRRIMKMECKMLKKEGCRYCKSNQKENIKKDIEIESTSNTKCGKEKDCYNKEL